MQKTENKYSQNEDSVSNNSSEEENEDILEFQVLLLGKSGVGKTCILFKLLYDTFNISQQTTIGVALRSIVITMFGQAIKVKYWDSSGQEIFKKELPRYYEKIQLFFLVYSVTDRDSFNSLGGWLEDVKNKNPNAMFLLVGNKSDVADEKRTVTKEDGEEFAEKNGMNFVEVSAKTGTGLSDYLFVPFIETFLEEEKKIHQSSSSSKKSGNRKEEESTNSSFSAECCSCCPCFKKFEEVD